MNYESAKSSLIVKQPYLWKIAKKDTAGNRQVSRRFYYYTRQGTVLHKHQCYWIRTKLQLIDILTKMREHKMQVPM